MRSSRHFFVVGVGVCLALGSATPGFSNPMQKPVAATNSLSAKTLEAGQSGVQKKPQKNNGASVEVGKAQPGAAPAATKSEPDLIPDLIKLENWSVTKPASLDLFGQADLSSAPAVVSRPKTRQPVKSAQTQVKTSRSQTAKSSAKSSATQPSVSKPAVAKPKSVVAPSAPATAQTTPNSVPVTPGLVPSTTPFIQAPVLTNPDGIPTQPIGPAKEGRAPDYLNSDPNLLSFPTKPEEVRLRGVQPITLQQAIELAKRNNREYQVAQLQFERSQAAVRQQQAALYPSLSAQSTINQALSASGDLQNRALNQAQQGVPAALRQPASSTESSALNGSVQLSYNIFTSGRRPAQIRAAEQQRRSDQLNVEVVLSQLRLDVSNAYYDLQQADETVRIQQSAVRNAEASLRDTVALERAGLGTRFDVLSSEVQLGRFRQNLIRAQADQQTRRRALAQLLAVPPGIDLASADPVQLVGKWTLSLEQSTVLALKNRAELEQQLAQRELAEQQRRAAIAGLGPTVNFTLQYNTVSNLRDFQLGFGNGYSAALGFNWNFFDGGAARSQARQQEINRTIAETNFARTREQISLQVETAYFSLQANFNTVDINRRAVEQAREGLRLARLRFQAGVGTQTDVINSENALTNAEGDLVNTILGYNRALASLQRAVTNLPIPTGSITPSIPTSTNTSPNL